YFYARDLHNDLHVPVGIIMASYGATAIEAWIGMDGLKAISSYRERAEAFDELAKAFIADTNSYPHSFEVQKARLPEKIKAWGDQVEASDPGLENRWMAPDFDASKWNPINLPVTAKDNPLSQRPQCIWFRKDVAIPSEWIGKELDLHLG